MKKIKLPSLPNLLNRKIYKTGQTRGADDDVIYQNRVNRNSTVLIPLKFYDQCILAPDNNGKYENGFIVLVKPEDYFMDKDIEIQIKEYNLSLGNNLLLFYETRQQWNDFKPSKYDYQPAVSRTNPLGGHFVARVPSTTSMNDEKIILGYNSSGMKGAGIRIYEYASSNIIKKCQLQLEYVYWKCTDALDVSKAAGMTEEAIQTRKKFIEEECFKNGLANKELLIEKRIISKNGETICPLCLDTLSAKGFYNRLEQPEGRDVPDLTVTQLNLFHIRELRIGEFNHKPYNLGWGHHHCNIVCKDSGISDTLNWMKTVLARNDDLK